MILASGIIVVDGKSDLGGFEYLWGIAQL